MSKLHRDIVMSIIGCKIPLDDLKKSLTKSIFTNQKDIPQILEEIKHLKEVIEYKVKELEENFNLC